MIPISRRVMTCLPAAFIRTGVRFVHRTEELEKLADVLVRVTIQTRGRRFPPDPGSVSLSFASVWPNALSAREHQEVRRSRLPDASRQVVTIVRDPWKRRTRSGGRDR